MIKYVMIITMILVWLEAVFLGHFIPLLWSNSYKFIQQLFFTRLCIFHDFTIEKNKENLKTYKVYGTRMSYYAYIIFINYSTTIYTLRKAASVSTCLEDKTWELS